MNDPENISVEGLWEICANADKIVVQTDPTPRSTILFESTHKDEIESLLRCLTLQLEAEEFECMCAGSPAIYIYELGRERVRLTNHHARSVRCSIWHTDVLLADPEKWLSWFDERGIEGPRKEFQASQDRLVQSRKDQGNWAAAMPKALAGVWAGALGDFGRIDVVPLRAELQRGVPDRGDRILALLEWFGSGAGPWSGFPSYEDAAEKLLLDFSTFDIIASTRTKKLSAAQTEGLARFFGGWTFSRLRPDGLNELPPELKQSLWLHSKKTKDKDKLSRAKRAFAK